MSGRLRFGAFRLDEESRQLWRHDELVSLTSRAFDTLLVLVRNAGRVVSRSELLEAVWNDVVVEENNLTQQISILRKTLGDDRCIETVARKGYCFVLPVSEDTDDEEPAPRRATPYFRPTLILGTLALLLAVSMPIASGLLDRDAQPIGRLAILPLTTRTTDASLDHLRTGFVEDLSDHLRRGTRIRVHGPRMADPKQRPDRVTGVDAVLSGSVEQLPEKVRFTLTLDRAGGGDRLWSRTVESSPERIGDLPAQIARELAVSMAIPPPTLPIRRPRFDAYEAYLKGRYHWNRRTLDDFEKAIGHYRRAIAIEPEYADAHAGLAMALGFLDREIEARAAAARALALDADLPELRAYLAFTLMHYDLQPELARREFERAIALGPSSPVVHHWYAFYLSYTGRHEEAIREIRKAHELDPLSLIIGNDIGVILLWAGRYDEAIEQMKSIVDLEPTYWVAHHYLALAYEQTGRPRAALSEWRKLRPRYIREAPTLALLGRRAEAESLIAEHKEAMSDPGEWRSPTAISQAYAALGDLESAFEWLERAHELRDRDLITLAVDRRFAPLRGDPRYGEMLTRIGLGHLVPPSLIGG